MFQNVLRNLKKNFTLPISIISAITGVVIYEAIQESVAGEILGWKSMVLVFVLFCMAVFILMFSHTSNRIEDLYRSRRLSIRFVPLGDNGKELYYECTKFIEEATEKDTTKILAVNSFLEVFKGSEEGANDEHKRKYLEAIERKMTKVDYHRIIQVKHIGQGYGEFHNKISENYVEHYRKIIQLRSKKGHNRNTRIEVAPALFPESFVVISNQEETNYLIWQINEHIPNQQEIEGLRLTGVFLIVDPDEQIVKYFKNWFNQIANSQYIKQLVVEDL